MGYFIEHLAVGTWLRNKGLERRDEIFLYCSSTQLSQLFKEPRTKETREMFFDMGSPYFAIIVLSTVCFSFWLRHCKEENYVSALLLTI